MNNRTHLFFTFIILLLAVMVFAGCGSKAEVKETTVEEPDQEETVTVMGEGKTVFPLTVRDKEGHESRFEIHTDKTIVGEALLELGLIDGEQGPYGMYIKSVNNITADYDTDGVYWAFYINDDYASTGVDTTPIQEGETYLLAVEK